MSLPDRRTAPPGDQLPAATRGPLWADGSFRLRLTGPAGQPARELEVARPFAVVGRLPEVDIQLDDRAVSRRHLYLHLDGRGLFVVDLATRTGTRFDGQDRTSGWLRPGQVLEVAGYRLELLECRVRNGGDAPEDEPRANLLADASGSPLARVTLYPDPPGATSPRTLGSELVFLGRGSCCGVRLEAAAAARIHCVLSRGRQAAYIVDLAGRGLTIDGRPLQGAARLDDGADLTIGSARFEVRIRPAGSPGEALAARGADPRVEILPPTATEALTPDAQGALLAWMMGQLHAQQGEALRRQAEFQSALTGLVRQMQEDQATLLSTHLDRTEAIHKELAALRGELDRRLGPQEAAIPLTAPRPEPLRLDPSPQPVTADPDAATSWLIGRINQLEEESRSSWRDVLGRLTGSGPRRPT